jgi:hypothetical protein
MDVSEVEPIIRKCHSADPDSIHQKDTFGFTPVYIAANSSNLTATRILFELGVGRDDVLNRDNDERLTALEVLQENLEVSRDFAKRKSYYFGVDPGKAPLQDEEAIETLFKGAIGDVADPVCTCGTCEEGWLSPRMRSCLQSQSLCHFC